MSWHLESISIRGQTISGYTEEVYRGSYPLTFNQIFEATTKLINSETNNVRVHCGSVCVELPSDVRIAKKDCTDHTSHPDGKSRIGNQTIKPATKLVSLKPKMLGYTAEVYGPIY
jgi:hypothetical protein